MEPEAWYRLASPECGWDAAVSLDGISIGHVAGLKQATKTREQLECLAIASLFIIKASITKTAPWLCSKRQTLLY